MPHIVNSSVNASMFGQQYTDDQSTTADMGLPHAPSVGPAKTGTLTTRTDNTTGTLTMDTGHGFSTADKIDLFFEGGSRATVTVGTVATNSVPISSGTGDNLPALNSAITAMLPYAEDAVVTGDNVVGIMFRSNDSAAVYTITASNGTTVHMTIRLDANSSYVWTSTSEITNPLAGLTVGKIKSSNANSTVAETMNGAIAYN